MHLRWRCATRATRLADYYVGTCRFLRRTGAGHQWPDEMMGGTWFRKAVSVYIWLYAFIFNTGDHEREDREWKRKWAKTRIADTSFQQVGWYDSKSPLVLGSRAHLVRYTIAFCGLMPMPHDNLRARVIATDTIVHASVSSATSLLHTLANVSLGRVSRSRRPGVRSPRQQACERFGSACVGRRHTRAFPPFPWIHKRGALQRHTDNQKGVNTEETDTNNGQHSDQFSSSSPVKKKK